MSRWMFFWQIMLLATSFALACGGCNYGPRIVPVSGKVLIDGKPVTAGFVRFVPNEARPAYGMIDKEGRFQLTTNTDNDGCITGVHQVEVLAKEFPTQTSTLWLVPRKYSDLSTSELQVEISAATDDLTLNLTWDGGKPFLEKSQSAGDLAP